MTSTEFKAYIIDRLTDLEIDPEIINSYNEPHRYYHNIDHVIYILRKLEKEELLEQNVYFLVAVFHDIFYDPLAEISVNESKSALIWEKAANSSEKISSELRDQVSNLIIETQPNVKASSPESDKFKQLDLSIFEDDFSKIIEYEHKIFKEFQHADWKEYQKKRIEFLKTFNSRKYPKVKGLIEYIKSWKPKIALYPGSFNPFHKGHMDILEKAEQIFDKVIVAAGVNIEKQDQPAHNFPPEILKYRQTIKFRTLLTQLIDDLGYDVTVVVGVRNSRDLEKEMESYYFNQDLQQNYKLVVLFPDRSLRHVSSSGIRILQHFEKNTYEI